MEQNLYGEFRILPLTTRHKLNSFDSSNIDLNDFLKNDALNYQKYMISKTNLCFFGNELVGYITLTIDTIGTKKVKVNDEFESKYSYPSIKIARLAADSRFERRGIGTHLLYAAIGKALSISDSVGCRFGFYCKKSGFFTKPVKNIANGIFICHKQVNNDTKSHRYSLKRQ